MRAPLFIVAGFLLLALGCGPKAPVTTTTTPVATGQKPLPSGRVDDHQQPAGAVTESTTIRFTEVTKEAGINFTYKNDHEKSVRGIVESLGGGLGWVDADLDGLLDLFLVGGGKYLGSENSDMGGDPCALYRNLGDWKFQNISAAAGAGFIGERFKHACVAADYDNDGFQDVLVTGYGGLQLWRNMGDGTFLESHEAAGLLDRSWSSAASWGDFNRDGNLDLYVAHYVDWSLSNNPPCLGRGGKPDVCPPKSFRGLDDMLYMSNGDGTFREASKESGLIPGGKGLAVLTGDVDTDGDLDIYVCNDTTENFLYMNDGKGNFLEEAEYRGCAVDEKGVPNGSMGVDLGDFNLDGRPDIWVANYQREANALYRNDGNGIFVHVSLPLGITAIGGLYVGFGTIYMDLDRDGYEDLFINNGHVELHPKESKVRQEVILMRNEQGESFKRIAKGTGAYIDDVHVGRGLAIADIDQDGDIDVALSNLNEPAALLRNESTDANSWLAVGLIGTRSPRTPIGARLELKMPTRTLVRLVKGGNSYLSQTDYRAVWGFPKDEIPESLTVIWPSGRRQIVDKPVPGTVFSLTEPFDGEGSSGE